MDCQLSIQEMETPYDYTIALIDADVLRYEIGAIKTNHPFLDGAKIPANPEFIYQRIEDRITRIKEATSCYNILLVFSGVGNFRFEQATLEPYKGKREGLEKPHHWITVNDYLKENYPYIIIDGREADDYLAERQRLQKNTIICTRDKDLLVTPGWHYRWACGENQPEVAPHYVDTITAWRNFFYQMLIGDSTDNIIGCGERRPVIRGGKEVMWRHGVGPKAARELLDTCYDIKGMYHIVRMEYVKLFPEKWECNMLENARLLFVGQHQEDLFDWSWLDKEWL